MVQCHHLVPAVRLARCHCVINSRAFTLLSSLLCLISCLPLAIFSAFLAESSGVSMKTEFVEELVILNQTADLQSFHMFCCKPGSMQRYSQEPLWERLMTFPPSNLDLMCIQHSARLVVTFPNSCLAFATTLLSMSCIIFVLISVGVCPPHWKFLCHRIICNCFSP